MSGLFNGASKLASAGDGAIKIWDLQKGSPASSISVEYARAELTTFAVSDDGKYLAGAGGPDPVGTWRPAGWCASFREEEFLRIPLRELSHTTL
jgi:hypothetical protein